MIRRSIQGQLLRRSKRREAAIFLQDGALWVADFVDGVGEIVDAPTWFRFNCAAAHSVSLARRRMEQESAVPLSDELASRIERLPCPSLAAPGTKETNMTPLKLHSIRKTRNRGSIAATIVVLIGIVALGFGGVMLAHSAIGESNAKPALDLPTKGATAISSDESLRGIAPSWSTASEDVSRECRLEAGITTSCVFQ